ERQSAKDKVKKTKWGLRASLFPSSSALCLPHFVIFVSDFGLWTLDFGLNPASAFSISAFSFPNFCFVFPDPTRSHTDSRFSAAFFADSSRVWHHAYSGSVGARRRESRRGTPAAGL